MGMAKPMPSEYSSFMLLIPTTSPSRFTRGPPELPALMAASVCGDVGLGGWVEKKIGWRW